jgi:hypothetical protein
MVYTGKNNIYENNKDYPNYSKTSYIVKENNSYTLYIKETGKGKPFKNYKSGSKTEMLNIVKREKLYLVSQKNAKLFIR